MEIILNIHEIFGRGENESCQLDVSSMPDKGSLIIYIPSGNLSYPRAHISTAARAGMAGLSAECG